MPYRSSLRLAPLLGFVLAACAAPDDAGDDGSLASEAAISSGAIVTFVAQHSARCVDVPSASTTPSTVLQQYTCNGSDAQKFRVKTNGNGTATFVNVHSGLCMDVRGDHAQNATPVQQYTCNGTAAQDFTLVPVNAAAGTYALKTVQGGCLDVTGDSPANGALMQEWSCTGGKNQTFALGAPSGPTGNQKSIKQWAKCDGVTDDSVAVANAFAAASHGAFTLLVDCPARVSVGTDVERTIFVDDGTTVVFSSAGKFILDSLYTPTFALANATNVTFTNWNVEWDGNLPVTPGLGYYYRNGVRVSVPGGDGAGVFNDSVITPWLTKHRGIVFDQSKGRVTSTWVGPANTGALFYLHGDTSNVTITGMHIGVPASAKGDRYIPFVFSFGMNYKSNQTVTAVTPVTSQYRETPHGLTFSNITLDGIYMGFQGEVHDATFTHIHSMRYGDVQDAAGGNSGGIGKWFPPPHLFYLNYKFNGDPSLFNRNITISDVTDDGIRAGVARDKGGSDTISGHALSLKLGCHDCSVDGYRSARPDGFMDVLSSSGLTVSNVVASFSSRFLNDTLPGWRFPQAPYANVTFENVSLTDTAATSDKGPISNVNVPTNQNIVFRNVTVSMQDWVGTGSFLPTVANQGVSSSITFTSKKTLLEEIAATSRSAELTLAAEPTTVKAGAATTLTWTSTGATACTASGAWSAAVGLKGAEKITVPTAGAHDYVLTCKNGADTTTATVRVTATP